jgi:hypothetical protein
MKSYDEFKAEMGDSQQQNLADTTNNFTNALTEIKHLCKGLGFTARLRKAPLDERRKKK